MDETPGIYQGVEDWQLYEQGLRFYLITSEKEQGLLEKISVLEKELRIKKKSTYSKQLLELDQALASFVMPLSPFQIGPALALSILSSPLIPNL